MTVVVNLRYTQKIIYYEYKKENCVPLCRANTDRFIYAGFIILFIITLPRLFASPSVPPLCRPIGSR